MGAAGRVGARPARFNALGSDGAEAKATAAVDAATRDGKIATASRKWALAYAKENPAGFGTFVDGAPVVVAPGEINWLRGRPKAPRTPRSTPRSARSAVR